MAASGLYMCLFLCVSLSFCHLTLGNRGDRKRNRKGSTTTKVLDEETKTWSGCSGDLSGISFGYSLSDNKFEAVYNTCQNVDNITVYVVHEVKPKKIEVASKTSEAFRKCAIFPYSPSVINNDYKEINRKISDMKDSLKEIDNTTNYPLSFERGHLAPKGDFSYSRRKITFCFENTSPQWASINKGNWRKLETKIRKTIKENETIKVITGTFGNLKISGRPIRLSRTNIPIPKYFWKVVKKDDYCAAFLSYNYPAGHVGSQPCRSSHNKCNEEFKDSYQGIVWCCEYSEIKALISIVPDLSWHHQLKPRE